MEKPSLWIAYLACLTVVTVLILGVQAESPDTQARFEDDMLVLPVVITGDAPVHEDS